MDTRKFGFKVGHKTDVENGTGCTVFIFENGARASVSVRGSAPASHETDLLRPGKLIREIHGIVLTGGSAYGLESAAGVMKYLEEQGIGYDTGAALVPLVPAAGIYDLKYQSSCVRPTKEWGYEAAKSASYEVEEGILGAATGATVGKLLGMEHASKTGLGISEIDIGGYHILAFVVVNALGEIIDETGKIVAGVRGDSGFVPSFDLLEKIDFKQVRMGENTTLGVVVTDFPLSKEALSRMAEIGHNGIVRAVRPSHTPFDGDIIFAVSTSKDEPEDEPYKLLKLYAFTELAVQRAILDAVKI